MLASVEVLKFTLPTMRALAAAGSPTSTHGPEALPPTPANTKVSVALTQFNHNTLGLTALACATVHHVAACAQNSMHINAAFSNHHD